MSVSLTLKNITRRYVKDNEEFLAVSNVNLQVKDGEFLTFLGPSGCGKTTTLRMIAGFETPSSGQILLGDQDVTKIPANERGMGFVFQNYALFPHMKIFDNVAYGLKIRNESSDAIKSKVREALAMVGLEKAEHRYPNQLSGGEQQRVALARVLVLRPKVILMDEPLSNLDAKLRLHMRTEIRRIQQELQLTCLYVTHDQKEALTMSDRIMVMNHGKIEQIGTPMKLYDDPATAFVADFIGQANLIPGKLLAIENNIGTIDVNGRKITARMGVLNPPKVGSNALLVVRPENLLPSETEHGLAIEISNALFEGDRIDYLFKLLNTESSKTYSMSIPFLPGAQLISAGTKLNASFVPQAGVLLNAD